jgi:hypothetical protein
MAAQADRARRSAVALAGLAGSIGGIALLAATTSFAVGAIGLVVMGASYVMVTISLHTSVQLRVDEPFRGRVVALYLMALLTGQPVGALTLGWLADGIGLRATMLAAAALLAAYSAFVVTRLGALRAID